MSLRYAAAATGLCILGSLALLAGPAPLARAAGPEPEWAANVSVIEACSCPMFCQCYFGTSPAGHHDHATGTTKHFCKANLAHRVNHGYYGNVKLDGVKYWIANDLGGDFSQGQMDWAVLYFDKAMSKEQRDAIGAIMAHVFPVKWNSFQTAEASIDTWEAAGGTAHATLDGGRSGEIRLHGIAGNGNAPVAISNLKYWAVPRHDGFVLMPNEVEAYRVGPKAFEFKGTNGFMITWDMASKDLKTASN